MYGLGNGCPKDGHFPYISGSLGYLWYIYIIHSLFLAVPTLERKQKPQRKPGSRTKVARDKRNFLVHPVGRAQRCQWCRGGSCRHVVVGSVGYYPIYYCIYHYISILYICIYARWCLVLCVVFSIPASNGGRNGASGTIPGNYNNIVVEDNIPFGLGFQISYLNWCLPPRMFFTKPSTW